MAIDTAYCTAAEYRAAIDKSDTGDDVAILADAVAASRLIERKLGRIFNQSAVNKARLFDPHGGAELRVDDLVSIDTNGIAIDTTQDGTYDQQFDPADESWVVFQPYNASELSEPYTSLRLMQFTGNTTRTVWPVQPRSVQITGTWGWPSVPNMITSLCIKITRDVRDSLDAGATGELQMLDTGVVVRGDTWRLWLAVEAHYSRRIPAVA